MRTSLPSYVLVTILCSCKYKSIQEPCCSVLFVTPSRAITIIYIYIYIYIWICTYICSIYMYTQNLCIYLYVYVSLSLSPSLSLYIYNIGRRWSDGSLFNSYNTKVYASLDCSTLPLMLTLYVMLRVKQGGIKYHFWVFGMTRLRFERRSLGYWWTLLVRLMYVCMFVCSITVQIYIRISVMTTPTNTRNTV